MKTQQEQLIDLFRSNNYQLTLGQILQNPFGYECRARFTELRKLGYVITCEKNANPSLNLYRMVEPMQRGQLEFMPFAPAPMAGH